MKKIIFRIIVLFVLLTSVFWKISAKDILPPVIPDPISIHLTITTPTNSLYDQEITVNACNSDNGSTPDLKVTTYCAILQSGIQNDWNWSWPPGAFLNSLGNIAGFSSKDKDGNDVYHYWSWSLNGEEGTIGLNQYELQPNDLISLTFIDPIPEPEITPPPPISHSSGGGNFIIKEKPIFNSKKAFEFLISQQKENGSWGIDLYTDWIALALGSTIDFQDQKTKLTNYFLNNKLTGENLTDYERHAIALMALGINPYNVNGENYIKKITDSFDGKQFGNKDEDNDDIFALIVLQNTNSPKNESLLKSSIDFVLSKQKENGSWDNSIDMTGAAMQSIAIFAEENFLLRGVSQVDEPRGSAGAVALDSDLGKEEFSPAKILNALSKAKEFLKQNQKDDDSFGNVSSTAWAIEGILALGEKPTDWIKNTNTPLDYLTTKQDLDGGIKNDNIENKIWQTAYVLSALSDKNWNQIMQKFTEPVVEKQIPIEKKILKTKIEKQVSKTIPNINLAKEITASPINALSENQKMEPTKTQNWFQRLISRIFRF